MDFERRFRVPDRDFRLADHDPSETAGLSEDEGKARRHADIERLADLQERLYAEGRDALLVVLQGLDASDKDGTIKHVVTGLNPQGVAVTAFKRPTPVGLGNDFFWRPQLPFPGGARTGA